MLKENKLNREHKDDKDDGDTTTTNKVGSSSALLVVVQEESEDKLEVYPKKLDDDLLMKIRQEVKPTDRDTEKLNDERKAVIDGSNEADAVNYTVNVNADYPENNVETDTDNRLRAICKEMSTREAMISTSEDCIYTDNNIDIDTTTSRGVARDELNLAESTSELDLAKPRKVILNKVARRLSTGTELGNRRRRDFTENNESLLLFRQPDQPASQEPPGGGVRGEP